MTDREIGQILIATKAQDSAVSINIDNQRVYVRDSKGLSKRVTRTIYRVRFEDGQLIGNLLNRTGIGEPWPLYKFNPDKNAWHTSSKDTQPQKNAQSPTTIHTIPKPKLFEMLGSYSTGDIRRYAIARLLYRKYHDTSEAVIEAGGDKWVRCGDCDSVFDVGSIGYLHEHYVTFCGDCRRDVSVMPAEIPERDTKTDKKRATKAFASIRRE